MAATSAAAPTHATSWEDLVSRVRELDVPTRFDPEKLERFLEQALPAERSDAPQKVDLSAVPPARGEQPDAAAAEGEAATVAADARPETDVNSPRFATLRRMCLD